jgi:hypothetical protein
MAEISVVKNLTSAVKNFVARNVTNQTQRATICAILRSFSLTLEKEESKLLILETITEVTKHDAQSTGKG